MTPGRLLLIEDDAEVAAIIEAGLAAEGYDVDRVAKGDGLIERVAAGAYAIIILDRMLPDGDGVDLGQALRATGSEVMILMLTAKDGLGDKLDGLRARADDYMNRPLHDQALT